MQRDECNGAVALSFMFWFYAAIMVIVVAAYVLWRVLT